MRRLSLLIAALALVLAGLPIAAANASDGPPRLRLDVTGWQRTAAPLPDAGDGIGPGSYLLIELDAPGEDEDGTYICTANFVWRDTSAVYLGAAGHCFLPSDEEKAIGANPWVTRVEVCVGSCAFGGQLGAVLNGEFVDLGDAVYARQHAPGDEDNQIGHDFGLVVIPSAQLELVRPEMPVWGGPTGESATSGLVCHYGNGVGMGETFTTKARSGVRTTELLTEDGWEAEILINGGDSGSAINMCDPGGEGLVGTDALGIITHGVVVPGVPIGWGTKVSEAKAMVLSDWKHAIDLVLAGEAVSGGSGGGTGGGTGENAAPTASFQTSCDGSTCTFDGTGSSDPDNNITSYVWDFGDGASATGATVTHAYGGSRTETYTVQLAVRDEGGATDAATGTVSCSGRGKSRACSV